MITVLGFTLASLFIKSPPAQVQALSPAGCASWITTALLDDGSAVVGPNFAWALNANIGIVLMDLEATKAVHGVPAYPIGIRHVDYSTVLSNTALMADMGNFDVSPIGITYMSAGARMGILNGGDNVIQINPSTGVVSIIATIPTNSSGFGDVYYANGYVYVSNIDDGMVYKIDPSISNPATSWTAVYDHGLDGRTAAGLDHVIDADNAQFTTDTGTMPGRRVTAIYVDGATMYYGVMWNDYSGNLQPTFYANGSESQDAYNAKPFPVRGELWSVSLDANGDPIPATAQLLHDQSNSTSNKEDMPIGDLTITQNGKLVVATAPYAYNGNFDQHNGNFLAFTKDGSGDYTVYEAYASVAGDEGTGGVDAFADQVLLGGEYNIQNAKSYGFAMMDQNATGGSNIDLINPVGVEFFGTHGTTNTGLKGETGDVEYICSGTPGSAVTIVKNTTTGNDTFTFSSTDGDLNGLSLATSNGSASSSQFIKPAGTYTITEDMLAGWSVDSISFSGDDDTGSSSNIGTGEAVIDLDSGEMVTVTFTNAPETCDNATNDFGGTLWRDINNNGIRDAGEPVFDGTSGPITASIYDDSGLVSTAPVLADGTYNFEDFYNGRSGSDLNIRVEFTGLPDWIQASGNGTNNATTVQFHSAPTCSADLGVFNPADYCETNPELATTCFVAGDPQAGGYPSGGPDDAIVTLAYDFAGGITKDASTTEVGSVWGLTYGRSTQQLYSAAFLKRHAGTGTQGLGGIYVSDYTGGGAPATSALITIPNAGDTASSTNSARNLTANPTDQNIDQFAWDNVGKAGLGGIDLSDDENTLYVTNLNTKEIITVDLTTFNSNGTLPGVGELGTLPNYPAQSCTSGSDRPFALKISEGVLYLGIICDASSTTPTFTLDNSTAPQETNYANPTSELSATVLAYDLDGGTWSTALPSFSLDFVRGNVHNNACRYWQPWSADESHVMVSQADDFAGRCWPQPLLSDIEFDTDGSMVLGFIDRGAHMLGSVNRLPSNPTNVHGVNGGDIMRAYYNGSSFEIENGGTTSGGGGCVTTQPGSPNPHGPGGGEYYCGDTFFAHYETSLGGIALLPNTNEVIMSAIDPDRFESGGLYRMDNTAGTKINGIELYFSVPENGTFNKGAGLGDVELMCQASPLEIGNYVWIDADNDGIQDPSELPISGITVTLHDMDNSGAQVGSTNTDANGLYYFGGLTDANISSGSLLTNRNYEIRIDTTQPALASYALTIANANADSSNDPKTDLHDSDAVTNGNNAVITYTTDSAGTNNHTLDFGFVETATLGNRVWLDSNADGIQDGGELGIQGVTVVLHDVINTPILTTTTDASGIYTFTNLIPGIYSVDFTPPAGYLISPQDQGADDTADSDPNPATGRTTTIALSSGANDPTWDAGMYRTVSIGSYVWEDSNNDGTQDGGESGLSGAVVELLVDSGGGIFVPATTVTGTAVLSQTTLADGLYFFNNLPEGDYRVRTTPPATYIPSTTQTTTDNDNTENDSNIATEPVAGTFESGTFTLSITNEPTETGTYDGDNQDNSTDTNGNMTVDFGFILGATIGDFIWTDVDADGIQDALGEPGIANVTVYLDLNSNGILDIGEPSDITDSNGLYDIVDLYAGTYPVTVDNATLPPMYKLTTSDPLTITLALSEDYDLADFGYQPQGQVTGHLYEDTNGNGTQDIGEPDLAGVSVLITDTLGFSQLLTTDVDGNYIGTVLPGPAVVDVVDATLPPGYSQTEGDDPTNVTVTVGVSTDAGNDGYEPIPVTIGDLVWRDENGDGIKDAGENGISGVTVVLYDATNTPILTTTTNASGIYTFTNLVTGDYSVNITPPAGHYFSPQDQGADDTADSDADTATGRTATTTLSSGEIDLTWDAGLFTPVSIGSFVWEDSNNNGTQDGGELGISGATVELLVDSGGGTFVPAVDVNGTAVSSQLTAADGLYTFTNLPPGDYRVRVTPPAGYLAATTQTATTNDDTESDSNIATEPVAGTFESGTFSLTVGGEPTETGTFNGDTQDDATETSGNMTVDFGFIPSATLGNYVWFDLNADGIQDGGETGIQGVTVVLYDATNSPVLTTTTDASGLYTFTNLIPGDYTVNFTPPAGYIISPQDQGGDDTADSDPDTTTGRTITTTLAIGQNDPTWDAGLYQPVSIGSYIWSDTNNDGLQDGGEPGISGAIIELLVDSGGGTFIPAIDTSGTAVLTQTTIADGLYNFTNLPPGDYRVRVTPPTGYIPATTQTTADNNDTENDSNIATEPITGTYQSGTFTLSITGEPTETGTFNGDSQDDATETNGNMTIDFGFLPGATIGDFIWTDVDADSIQDALGEPGIANVTVYLDLNSNGILDIGEPSDITDSNGLYDIVDLYAGTYPVTVDNATLPPMYKLTTSAPLTITLALSEDYNDADFGYQPQGQVTGHLYEDTDGNGTQDIGEPDLAGVSILITDTLGFTQIVTTDIDGNYIATVLPGSATVDVIDSTLPVGYVQTEGDDPTNVTVTVGVSTDAGNDGYQPGVSIGDYVWEDTNGDGIQDGGETGISGVTIFLDLNGNGTLDGGEPSDITDGAGAYDILGIGAGTYTATIDATTIPAGFGLTTANNPLSVTVVASQDYNDADFGFQQQDATIGDFVWNDLNGDGIQDGGETGIAGVTIFLDLNGNGTLDGGEPSDTTDGAGAYDITNLPAGTYTVTIDATTAPVGFGLTTANDPHTVVLAAGEDHNDADFGYQQQDATIGDFVWNDLNGDGIQDGGEAGIAGVTVFLDLNGNGTLDGGEPSDTTDGAGAYDITGLATGTYTVTIDSTTVPTGFNLTTANDPLSVVLAAGEDHNDADFGYQQQDATIGDFVWNDLNGDGIQDGGEAGIAGVTVFLDLNGNGTLDGGEPSDTTDGAGAYDIINLPAGTYTVTIDSTTAPVGFGLTTANDPHTVVLAAGEDHNDADFGFQQQDATIGDFVWNDLNGDGIQDGGETGIAGVTVFLDLNGNGTLDGGEPSDTTDGAGAYDITGLAAGTYTVTIDSTTAPAGFGLTTANDPHTVILSAGEDHNNADFGYQQQDATIGDFVWNDLNGDGVQDGGEAGIAGVTVFLDLNGNGTLDGGEPSDTTDGAGAYDITNLPAGTYTVTIDSTTAPIGFSLTTANDPHTVVLAAGEDHNDADFGYQQQDATIGDFVWNDLNGDGVQDGGETGIAGVTVFLDLNGNGTLDGGEPSDTTDGAGAYDITNLAAGTYTVTIDSTTAPAGFTLTTANDPHTVVLTPGEDHNNADFGYQQQDATIGDFVWHDLNGDGVQDGGEPAISGVTVFLDLNGNGTLDGGEPSDTTDGAGAYDITGLAAGTYTVTVDSTTVPANYALTTANDPHAVVLSAGEDHNDADFGYQAQGDIFGHIFEDTNGNGVQDGVEPNLSGVDVLITDNQGVTQTVTTDASGNYTTTVAAGSVTADIDETTLPSNYNQTAGIDPSTVNVPIGGSVDAGNDGFQEQGTLIGFIFEDSNGNGVFDGGEPPLSGIPVVITDSFGITRTVVTDVSGNYTTTIAVGNADVDVDESVLPVNYLQTAGTDPDTVSITAGLTTDAGDDGYQPQIPSIGDFVWEDINGDGIQDAGEVGIGNVTVFFDQNNNGLHDGGEPSFDTLASGFYDFAGLSVGTYTVTVDIATVPAGYIASTPTVVVRVITGVEDFNDVDFGYQPIGDVYGHLFEDSNGNGVQDGGEPNLSGVDVVVTDSLGITQTVTTDVSGNYTATVPAGNTTANVVESTLPAGFVQTAGVDPSSVTAVSGASTDIGNDGYQQQNANIGDYVWEDSNGDGIQDGGESPIAGVTVFLDLNGNGLLDGGEPSDTTDGAGAYDITNLPAGTYTVTVDSTTVPAGYALTTANDPHTVVLSAGEDHNDADFGYQQQGDVFGHIFEDSNGNGIQDGGEPNLAGIDVVITDSLGVTQTVTTDASGNYTATVPIGNTTADVDESTLPAGYNQTAGVDPTSVTAVLNTSTNIGNDGYQQQNATIGDFVWEDTNGDGVQDGGEAGIAGVTVFLDLNSNGTLDGGEPFDTTDGAGAYDITNLAAGTYTVKVDTTTLPAGYVLTTANDPHTVILAAGEDHNAADFGYQPQGDVFGHIFEDTNGNGFQDGGEPNLSGIDVVITDSLGVTQTVTTDASGNYTATVPIGNTTADVVEATLPAGFAQTAGADPTSVTAVVNTATDIGNDGYQQQNATIGDFVWNDLNGDGIQDGGETGIAGVTIFLDLNGNGTLDGGEPSDTTDGAGAYDITNLPAGTYTVTVDSTTAPVGFALTTANDPHTVVLSAGEDHNDADFGYQQQDATIGDFVWNDLNGDGVQDGGEAGIAGVTIFLDLNGNGTLDGGEPSDTTDGAGAYDITNLAAGTYTVTVDATTAPVGFGLTTANDPLSVVLAAGEDYNDADFGYQQQDATIGDFVWEDTNGDGVQDGGEAGIAGVTVFLDLNGNGILDGGEPSDTTDGAGAYDITGLATGTYTVTIDSTTTPVGFGLTTANDPLSVVLAAGEDYNDADFGYQQQDATIGDFVWEDTNGDSIQDGGEAGIAGVTVFLDLNGNGILDGGEPNDTTDGAGAYDITGLATGTYTVTIDSATVPAGYALTTANDPHTVVLSAGEDHNDADFGYQAQGDIFGHIFEDTNGNGSQDGGEPNLSGIDVLITDSLGITQTVTTDASGNYTATVPVGNTTSDIVEATLPAGYMQTAGADPSSVTAVINTATDIGNDGYQQQNATIGDFVWEDLNGDGVQDGGEAGIAGVTVFLDLNGNGTLDGGEPSDTTDGAGAYDITNLAAGTYTVTVDTTTVPAGYALTTANNPHAVVLAAGEDHNDADFGYQQQGIVFGHIFEDTNGNGSQDGGEPNLSGIDVLITDSLGITQTVTTDASGNYTATVPVGNTTSDIVEATLPAGYVQTAGADPSSVTAVINTATDIGNDGYQQQNATIGDFVWEDLNGDGVQDGGEAGIAGVTVFLDLNGNGTLDGGEPSDTTDGAGAYDITGLAAGTYTVTVDATTAPAGFGLTTANNPHSVVLAAGEDHNDADFGYQQQDATIGDFVWEDTNADGIQDGGEAGIAGVTVFLDLNGNGTLDGGEPSDITDGAGAYDITNLAAGTYTVTVDTTTVPAGYALTTANNPHAVVLAAGEDHNDADFGYQAQGDIFGHIFEDSNGNGVQDGGEPNLTGIDVVITDSLGITQTVTTDASGNYTATVPAGNATADVVESTLPVGFNQTAGGDPSSVTAVAGTSTDIGDDGYQQQNATIGDFIWNDLDANGIFDIGEPAIENVTLDLYIDTNGNGQIDIGETVFATESTDASGNYDFTGLPAGDYLVLVTDTNNVLQSFELTAGVDPAPVTITAGEDYNDADFGYFELLTLGNQLWFDTNEDGVYDPTEASVPAGVVLNLLDGLGNPILDGGGNPVQTTTDVNGQYLFTDLYPGEYIVHVDAINFQSGGVLEGYVSSNGDGGDPDNDFDGDDNGLDGDPVINGILSDPIELNYDTETVGDEDGDGNDNTNFTVDFGLVNDPTAVNLTSFTANHAGNGRILLQWETESEIDNFGFRIYRSQSNDFASATEIHFEATAVPGGTGPGASYSFEDTAPSFGTWYYWLVDVETDGDINVHPSISVSTSNQFQLFLPAIKVE